MTILHVFYETITIFVPDVVKIMADRKCISAVGILQL